MEDLLENAHEFLVRRCGDPDQQVSLTGDRVCLEYPRNRRQVCDHLVRPTLGDLDRRESEHREPQPRQIEFRAESCDDAGLEHLVDSRLDSPPSNLQSP